MPASEPIRARSGDPEVELSIVIPAFNEVTTVVGVVLGHRAAGLRLASTLEILVCDDGSSDGTLSSLVAASEAVTEMRLIRHDANLGIARTLKELYARTPAAGGSISPPLTATDPRGAQGRRRGPGRTRSLLRRHA